MIWSWTLSLWTLSCNNVLLNWLTEHCGTLHTLFHTWWSTDSHHQSNIMENCEYEFTAEATFHCRTDQLSLCKVHLPFYCAVVWKLASKSAWYENDLIIHLWLQNTFQLHVQYMGFKITLITVITSAAGFRTCMWNSISFSLTAAI